MNSKPRMATIITLEDCHFAILNKADYQSTIMIQEKQK